MSYNIEEVVSPDDSGSDSFSRFCYQAHVAFPFCVECALNGGVKSVIAEHVEDIAVERESHWQFIQIKTRDRGLGPWKLTDLTKPGGAFHSLLRSHRALPPDDITLEIFLEGPLKRNDQISLLETENGRRSEELKNNIQSRLQISADECEKLLEKTRLVPDQPSRDSIISRNLRALAQQNKHLPHDTLESIYWSTIQKVHEAMAIALDDAGWWPAILGLEEATDAQLRKYELKRLAIERLAKLMRPLSGSPQPLLKELVSPKSAGMSRLEEKLLAGGATQELINDAKGLRAQAAIKELEEYSSSIWGDDSRP